MKTREVVESYVMSSSKKELDDVVEIISCLRSNNVELGIFFFNHRLIFECKSKSI